MIRMPLPGFVLMVALLMAGTAAAQAPAAMDYTEDYAVEVSDGTSASFDTKITITHFESNANIQMNDAGIDGFSNGQVIDNVMVFQEDDGTLTLTFAPDGESFTGILMMTAGVYAGESLLLSGTRDGDSSGCFIATAAYGSPLASEVNTLSAFRDEVLEASGPGRRLVRTYYAVSPPAADTIRNSPLLRACARTVLYPAVAAARHALSQ